MEGLRLVSNQSECDAKESNHEAYLRGRSDERERLRFIMTAPQALPFRSLALFLAAETRLSVNDVLDVLAAAAGGWLYGLAVEGGWKSSGSAPPQDG